MPRLAMIFGGLLIALGVVSYFLSGGASPTAFIPAGFGLVFIVFGLIAQKPNLRMHAMHGVALFALIGAVAPLWRVIKAVSAGGSITQLAVASQLIMGVLCLLLLILCVRSFIAARRARKAQPAV